MPARGRGRGRPFVKTTIAAAVAFAWGMNIFFNQADYNAYSGTKTLGNAAALVTAGITDSGSINGTYFDSGGVMRVKTSGTAPRLNYVGGNLDGMLVEPAATNLALQCTQIGGTGWSNAGTSGVSNSFTGTAPDGVTTLAAVDFLGSSDDRDYDAGVTVTAGQQYTISVWAYNLTAGKKFALGWFDAALQVSPDITCTTTLTRYSWTGTVNTATTIYPYVNNQAAGGANTGFRFWGMQLELGPVATSTIITAAATVTRTDSAVVQAKASISGYSQTAGTWVAKAQALTTDTDRRIIGVSAANNAGILSIGNPSTSIVEYDGTNAVVMTATATNNNLCAFTYSGTAGAISINGAAASGGTFANYDPVSLKYGWGNGGTGNMLIGSIRRLAWSPTAASNAQLAQLSAGTL